MLFLFQFFHLARATPCPNHTPEKQVFFGDLHVHTHRSLDASLQGTLTTHQQAYDFARGGDLYLSHLATSLRLSSPLDFVAITDHAEFLGEVSICTHRDNQGFNSLTCRLYRNIPSLAFFILNAQTAKKPRGTPPKVPRLSMCKGKGVRCVEEAQFVWKRIIQEADINDSPCSFTTFPAYEWSAGPNTENLHRNIIFNGIAPSSHAVSYFDAATAEQLYEALDFLCQGECDYISIPHNANLSNGRMFKKRSKAQMDRALLQQRHNRERAFEIFQHKGASECSPGDTDEHCGFEQLPFNNLTADRFGGLLSGKPTERDSFRYALGEGLWYESQGLPNPYAYGVVAATDTHIGAAGAAHEIPFFGHGGAGKSKAQVVSSATLSDSPWFNPGGITAVWAEENTRASIYGALKRRESYGTSGTRIALRLFASEKETEHSCGTRNWLNDLQQNGVPMGGKMKATLPKIHILAQADPDSAALAKIEVVQLVYIKGEVQKTVDTVWSNDTGQKTVCTIWDMDTIDAPSIVYVRVLEHLSPRWSVDACKTRKCPEMATKWIQERAWSSPIWISPR